MANSGVRSWHFYRSSTRLIVSGRVERVALWGGFRLGAGWYPRLERVLVDGRLEHHFPREVQATRLRRTYCGRSLYLRSQAGSNKPPESDGTRLCELWMNGCQGTPWSEKLDGKDFHGALGGKCHLESR